MHRTAVVGSCVALLAKSVVAAPGDSLVVTGDLVNVRAGPAMDDRVNLQVRRDQRALELAREGEWVRVKLAGRGEEGWIHRSLLEVISRARPVAEKGVREASSARPEAARGMGEPSRPSAPELASPPADGAAPAASSESEALASFRAQVDDLNARARALAEVELFAGAEPAGRGTVRVLVTETWRLVPEAGQESYTNALFDHWRAVADGAAPLRLQVVDPSGAVVTEKSGPASP
jgi:Bacterial SH3 domain